MQEADSSKSFDQNNMYGRIAGGTLGVYQYPFELNELLYKLDQQFPEVFRRFTVGKTFEGRSIMGYMIGLDLTTKDKTMSKPAVLVTGAHHARELTSISMSVYTVLRLLYGYVKEEPATMYLLQRSAIVVVPVVNVDGYSAIGKNYWYTQEFSYVRKNMHVYDE